MGIRIDRIELHPRFRWTIRIKGLHGQGVYATLFTGERGKGLYYVEDDLLWFNKKKADAGKIEVLPVRPVSHA